MDGPGAVVTVISRRGAIAGAAVGLSLSGAPLAAASGGRSDRTPELTGLVHGLGVEGRLYPGFARAGKNGASVLTTLNLASGAVRQTPLDLAEGHAAMSLGDGRILCTPLDKDTCLVVDAEHKVIKPFVAPAGFAYGGHALVLPERRLILVALCAAQARTPADVGKLQVYDLDSLELVDEVPTDGLHPHEIQVITGANELALSQYGSLDVPKAPFEYNVVDPKLTILDAQTFKPKRHYSQADFNAMVTHMRVARDGAAYFVLTQFIAASAFPDDAAKGEDGFAAAALELERRLGHPRTFPLPYQALQDRMLAPPLPFVRVETQTGRRQIIDLGDARHLRSQSVAYNAATDQAIALYYHSDNLVLFRPPNDADVITGAELGLVDIRGVTDIPGTTLIAVMGTNRGVSVFDLAARKLVANWPTTNFADTHLYYDASSI
jgi:hypothetical protein